MRKKVRNYSRLKETKETQPLNVTCDPRLYPGPKATFFPLAIKDITGTMVKCLCLWIK